MALPLAAIAAAVTTAALQHYRDRQNSTQQAGGPQVGKLVIGGTALRASTANLLMGPGSNLTGGAMVPHGGNTNVTISPIQRGIEEYLSGRVGNAPRGSIASAGGSLAGLVGPRGPGGIPTFNISGRRRYRRMNVGNIKALRRAGRRLTSFVKLAKSMVQLEKSARIKKPRRRR